MGSSAVRSIVVDLDLDLGLDGPASPFTVVVGDVSIDSKAALARPKGVVTLFIAADGSCEADAAGWESLPDWDGGIAGVLDTTSLGVGVGDGEMTDSDFFLPPPKKLFNVCCFPLNSSINLVANLGGSGAVLGGSVG